MQDLIKIIEKDGTLLTSARILYEFLELKTDFLKWCERMFEYGFTEGKDYNIVIFDEVQNEGKRAVKRQKIDYDLNLRCASHISMIQRNEKGEQARDFFFEAALRHKAATAMPELPQTHAEALRALADSIESEARLRLENQAMQPKAEFYDTVTGSKDTFTLREVAKVLNMGIGQNKLFEFLRNNGVLMRNNEVYQAYVENGWFRCIESSYQDKNGDTHIYKKTVAFQKGVDGIRKLLNKRLN